MTRRTYIYPSVIDFIGIISNVWQVIILKDCWNHTLKKRVKQDWARQRKRERVRERVNKKDQMLKSSSSTFLPRRCRWFEIHNDRKPGTRLLGILPQPSEASQFPVFHQVSLIGVSDESITHSAPHRNNRPLEEECTRWWDLMFKNHGPGPT